jgi:hypothetical protein
MYRRLTQAAEGHADIGRNPVRIRDDAAFIECAQLTDYLLCAGCEDRFGHWENYVARISLQLDDKFSALDVVKPLPGLISMAAVVADASELDCPSLARFAVSVFWRASVSSKLPDVRLGRYETDITGYLQDDNAGLPSSARLVIHLFRTDGPVRYDKWAVTEPTVLKQPGAYMHRFGGFGMQFGLFVGGALPPGLMLDELCFCSTRRVGISSGDQVRQDFERTFSQVRPKGALAKRSYISGRGRGGT